MGKEVSRLQELGVELNTGAYGTTVASFTRGLLVTGFDSNLAQTVEPVPEVRGNLETRRVTQGPQDHAATLSFALDVGGSASGGIGDFLGSIYGKDTGTDPGGGDFDHKFTLLNDAQPSQLNFWSAKDQDAKQYRGFRPGSVKFTFGSGEGMSTVEVEGILKDTEELATQTLVFANMPLILPSQATTFKVGGVAITNFETVEITITREQEPFRPIGNSKKINELFSGKEFKIEIVLAGLDFANETEKDKFAAVTSSSFELIFTDASGNTLDFDFPEIFYQVFDGPAINDTDILKVSATSIVTGDAANHSISLRNQFNKQYDDGTTIV